MRTNLLEFLFGEAVMRETKDHALGEQVLKLFEEAEKIEGVEMVANKKSLGDALKAIGIDEPVEAGVQSASIKCADDSEYHEYVRILHDPNNMTKLAELGWVAALHGDTAMANEEPEYLISFIEIQTAETSDTEKVPDDEKIRKDAQKDAATEFERSGKKDENPVELDDPGDELGGKTTGIGKPADGKDPEGKPKGSTKKVKESKARACLEHKLTPKAVVDELLEMTSTGAVPAFPSGGAPMSVHNQQTRRGLFNRRRKAPPAKPNGVSPANS